MYTGTTRTVLGEFSELQYSLSPSYQTAASCYMSNRCWRKARDAAIDFSIEFLYRLKTYDFV